MRAIEFDAQDMLQNYWCIEAAMQLLSEQFEFSLIHQSGASTEHKPGRVRYIDATGRSLIIIDDTCMLPRFFLVVLNPSPVSSLRLGHRATSKTDF